VLNPLSAFDPARVPVASGKRLVFHCHAGMRCGPAAIKMVESGYQGEINRLQGGFKAWVQVGGPTESGA
jgi:rhodanese-related sulfurtransferase